LASGAKIAAAAMVVASPGTHRLQLTDHLVEIEQHADVELAGLTKQFRVAAREL
jgi:hypothetical protein